MEDILSIIITACGGAAVSGFFSLLAERRRSKQKKQEDDKALMDKLDSLSAKLDGHIRKDAEAKASESRSRILSFGDETRRGYAHTKEMWDDLLCDVDRYEDYCATHPQYENNRAVQTIKYLKAQYALCLDKNNFL